MPLLILVVSAHAAVLPTAQWQPYEFLLFHAIDTEGSSYVWGRVTGWSPRPVSEVLVWFYATAVRYSGSPLVVSCLAALWIGGAGALYLAARRISDAPLLLATVLFAGFLLLEKPGEVFYWPVGSLAYLTALSAIAVSCLLMNKPAPTKGDRLALCAALLVAAGSAEMGTAFVLLYGGLRLILWALRRFRDPADAWTWGVPLLLAVWVVQTFGSNRAQITTEAMLPGSPTLGSAGLSLLHAVWPFLLQAVGLSFAGMVTPAGFCQGLVIKLALFWGFRPLVPGDRREIGARTAALLGAAFASIAFSLKQFGVVCCERHATTRQGLFLLAIYTAAQAFPRKTSRRPWQGSALLLVVMLVLSAERLPSLVAAAGQIRPTISARAQTWLSGHAAADRMTFHDGPAEALATGWSFPAGTVYHRSSDAIIGAPPDWQALAVMLYFGKHDMDVAAR